MTRVAWALTFLRPYRARAGAVAGLSFVHVGLAALAPWPFKLVVDHVLGSYPLPGPLAAVLPVALIGNPAALLVLFVVAGLVFQVGKEGIRMVDTQLQVGMGQRITYDLRGRLIAHLQALPLRDHLQRRTADSVYRLDADAYCVDALLLGGLFPLALAGLNLAVMFVVLIYLDATLALLSLAVVPFLYLSLRHHTVAMTPRVERVKTLESRVIDRAFEILTSVAAVKSFAREPYELSRFSGAGEQTRRARLDLTWQQSLFTVMVATITAAGTALVLVLGGLHVLAGTLTVGGLLVVVAYLAAVYGPVASIAHTTSVVQQARVSARRVRELLALAPEALDDPNGVDASSLVGRIRFDQVGFRYAGDGREVLQDVSFEAGPGELVALVGLTGAGKTTLANLIPRFFEPTRGRVLVDERDVADYRLRSLRERIAVVPQVPVLLSGTIADNIRYGRLSASDADVEAAARAAQAHAFIARLPGGYETPVAEAGATLSGGERQRLGLARALVKAQVAPILILDEPTSSVDALSEQAIFDALRALRPDHTILVIAHRLSTIRDATRILVLDDGRVIGSGTHESLLASNALYRRLCARLSVGVTLDESETDPALQASR